MFEIISTGKSVRGTDILGYTNRPSADSYLYVIGGVHGDEGEGIYIVEQLHNWLQIDEPSVPMIMVPMLNPDGLADNTRVNANGVDLNRNWPVADWSPEYPQERYNPGTKPLSEPENIFLYELFKKYVPKMIFSIHSWNQEPLLNFNPLGEDDAHFIAQYNNYACKMDVGYPTPGSLGTYATEVLQCGIITYECPLVNANLTLDEIWLQNEQALIKYFTKFAK